MAKKKAKFGSARGSPVFSGKAEKKMLGIRLDATGEHTAIDGKKLQ